MPAASEYTQWESKMELEEAIAKIAELESSVNSTVNKNAELLREVKLAKAKVRDIDPDEYANMLVEVESLRMSTAALEKDSASKLEALTQVANAKSDKLEKYLIDSALTKALSSAGVHKDFIDAVFAMHRNNAKLGVDDAVLIGDKSIDSFVTEWSASDKGKPFISSSSNFGGGSHNSSGSTSHSGKKFLEMDDAERISFKQSDPEGFAKAITTS